MSNAKKSLDLHKNLETCIVDVSGEDLRLLQKDMKDQSNDTEDQIGSKNKDQIGSKNKANNDN